MHLFSHSRPSMTTKPITHHYDYLDFLRGEHHCAWKRLRSMGGREEISCMERDSYAWQLLI